MIKLFVSGLPLDMTELNLAKLISPHGHIATIKLVRDKQTKKGKGYAFVEMANEQGAQQVIEALNNAEMADRILTVKIAEEKPAAVSAKTYVKIAGPGDRTRPKRPRRPAN